MPLTSILITGANGALGRSIAKVFLKKEPGAHVFLGVRTNRSDAGALAAEHTDRCHLVDLDVTSPDAWETAVSHITENTGGKIDVLVNNAGFHKDNLLAMMPPEDWHSVINANLNGVFYGCRAVTKKMMAQRFGRIVNIASLSALLAPAGQANYVAAKAGVAAMSQALAKEVARAGITVNTLCPGYIETEALGEMTPEQRKTTSRTIPMRRFGQPEEVAAAVHFLTTPEAGYITGAVLKIDGGIF